MPVIIDGYNLLWAIQGAAEDTGSVTDFQLCAIVSRYLKAIGQNGEIIFDGTGPPDKSCFDNIDKVEVFFTGLASDADTVIEHKIETNTAPRRLTIVSSDRRLRRAARIRKATSVKSDVFWKTVQKQLSSKGVPDEPMSKRLGLSDSETNQWLEFFGLDQ